MQALGEDLRRTVEAAAARLSEFDEAQANKPRAPGKWSPKQVIGHLVDSACNNHRRFVLAREQKDLVFPGYDEKKWAAAQAWEHAEWNDLLELWRLYNLHLARVISETPSELAHEPRSPHSLDRIAWRTLPADQPATLAYLMRDYVGHLRHHLAQALAPAQD
jgi:hypothetical protein